MTVAIIQTALPVFIALAIGMICRSRKFISREGIDALKKVVVDITLPFVLLGAFATAEYSAKTIIQPVLMFAICCGALALGFFISHICRIKSRLTPFLATGFEAGMLGYALFSLLFPGESLSSFAILDLGQTLFVFTLFKILLSGKHDKKEILFDMVRSPILWATAIGVSIGATGLYSQMQEWKISGIFDHLTDFLSAPTSMIILLVVGYDLHFKDTPWKQTAGVIVMRAAVMIIAFFVIILLNRTVLGGMISENAVALMLILPPPYVTPIFADDPSEQGNVSSAISALTLVTILLFAVFSIITGANTTH